MPGDTVRTFLFRLALPIALLAACIVRYNAVSAVYLGLLLCIPLLPSPGKQSFAAVKLQKAVLGLSIIFVFAQAIFQIVLLSWKPYGWFVQNCTESEAIARQIGFNRLEECSYADITRLIAPDVVVLLASLVCVVASRDLRLPSLLEQQGIEAMVVQSTKSPLEEILSLFVALMLLLAGIMQPCILCSVYFLSFLVLGTCWAFHLGGQLGMRRLYGGLQILLIIYAGVHVFVLYLYQMEFFQQALKPVSFTARLLGLPELIDTSDCSLGRELQINKNLKWPFYVYPVTIFCLYWILSANHRIRSRKPLLDVGAATSPQYSTFQQPEEPAIPVQEIDEIVNVQGTFSSIMMFLMRQSYIAALIIMMIWSITYHSWLTFVLLLWACLSWVTPFARWFCMVSSPYLVIYSEALLIIQYVYGMNLNDAELPVVDGNLDYAELGLMKWTYPVLHLGAQALFTWVFLVTLRQHVREKKMRKKKVTAFGDVVLSTLARPLVKALRRSVSAPARGVKESNVAALDQLDSTPSDDAREFMNLIKGTLSKYWILVCCSAFLLVALQNSVSVYQIVHMAIFLMGFIVYQFSSRSWKIILRPLWWFVVVYSVLILLLIYTYQFKNMHMYWSNGTHLSDQWLYDIGLRQHTRATLLVELLIPVVFSIILVIQLHFFHKPLMVKLNSLLRYRKMPRQQVNASTNGGGTPTDIVAAETRDPLPDTTSVSVIRDVTERRDESESQSQADNTLFAEIVRGYDRFTYNMWRIAELHALKMLSFIIMLVVVQQVSAINAVFLILLVIAMPSERLQRFMNYIFILYSSIVVIVFMFYQLQFVKEDLLFVNCSSQAVNSNVTKSLPVTGRQFSSNPWWLGFHKSAAVSVDVRGYLFIILFIVFIKVIKHHQELMRFQRNREVPQHGILFEKVTRKMADEDLVDCVKYLCNHFFSIFGMEVNLITMVVCMGLRSNALAVLHSLWIAVFLLVSRRTASRVWSAYVAFQAVLLPVQYLLLLGWPPGLCKSYPWTDSLSSNLVHWLFLTDVSTPQDSYILLADFFQLLVACCQAKVFSEKCHSKSQAASNETESLCSEAEQYVPPDFTGNKSWLDFAKIIFLDQFIWLTLSIVYVTAQNTTSLFNFGFLVGCFFFLWHGQGLYLRPRKQMRGWWMTFIGYNFLVLVAKVWLQLVSCVYFDKVYSSTSGCYSIQLLSLYCIRSNLYDLPPPRDDCPSKEDTGLVMDTVCFVFALVQYRIFSSSYFRFVVREHRRQSEMASRGAQLVEEHIHIRFRESIQQDKRRMQQIKNKVTKLKQKLADLNPNAKEPLSHYEAIYSGDYYLYDTEDSDDVEHSDSSLATQESNLTAASTNLQVAGPQQTSEVQVLSAPLETDQRPRLESYDILMAEDASATQTSVKTADVLQENNRGGARPSSAKSLRRRRRKPERDASPDVLAAPSSDASLAMTTTLEKSDDGDKSFRERANEVFAAIQDFFVDVAHFMVRHLDEASSDYRAITQQMEKEKRERSRSQIAVAHASLRQSSRASLGDTSKTDAFDKTSQSSQEDENDTWTMITSDNEDDSWKKKDAIGVQLAVSLYYAMLAHTDLLCYFLMIVNHMYYACILSMPLPFFVFLWGMLSIPRPTKRFWITIITYVELVIVVKFIFQFPLFKFNNCNSDFYTVKEAKSPLCPPRIIGIERNAYSSVCDLLLLLACFFHRFALKAHGLWREKAFGEDDEAWSPTEQQQGYTTVEGGPVSEESFRSSSTSTTRETGTASSRRMSQRPPQRSLLTNVKRFIQRMLDPDVGTGAVDVYALMFGAQFIIFLIILFSWSAFSSAEVGNANFAKIIEENVVPKTFLYMLLTQFILIVLDRYLYMRKLVFVKLLYLVLLVFVFHIFMFVIVPDLTSRSFIQNVPAIFMYLFQCLYFGLSAYQVRCGYPTRILGNFLTKNYTLTSGLMFQGIQAIPFLLELRSVLDWVCTPTTLTLSHWLKMEDIYANVYVIKCWRDSEKTWPHPRGMRYWTSSKWLVGGLVVLLLIVVIWFPLLFMSFINSAYIDNTPVEATFTLTIGGYQPLFHVTSQQQYLRSLSNADINQILKKKDGVSGWDNSKAEQGIQDYKKTGTIVSIKVASNSSAIWTISPPSRDYLINDLESEADNITLRFRYLVGRASENAQAALVSETVSGVTSRLLKPGDPVRQQLAMVLRSPSGEGPIQLTDLFPSFMQVPGSGSIKPVSWLGGGSFVNCTIVLRRGSTPHMNTTQVEWWELIQDSPAPIFSHDYGSLEVITLNDLVPPLHLSFFASKGIIGLYVGFVWLVGKFVRLFFSSISYRIMFDELPNVNRILKLCLEIYMARESKELTLEEDLFALLLFLYRSPETLIKWTKYKRL